MSDLSMKVCEWMSMGKVGISSATMVSIALGLKKPVYGTHFGYPYDPADLNRCRILVKHIPEIRDSFKKIGRRVPGFKPILDNWDELITLLDEEVREDTGRAPRTYARMKELLGSMTTIYDFIADPFKAVRAGYRPTYMTCVSAVSHKWWLFAKLAFESCADFRNILDMTLKEIFSTFLHSVFRILATLTFPIGMWFWAWVQYRNVQHAIRADEQVDSLHR